jgi:hypothetical protein
MRDEQLRRKIDDGMRLYRQRNMGYEPGGPSTVVLTDSSGNVISSGAPADALASAGLRGLDVRAFAELYNGASFDRMRSIGGADGTTGTGLLGTGGLVFDVPGGVYNRVFSARTYADGSGGSDFGAQAILVFDGTSFAKARNSAAANMGATTQPGALQAAPPGQWVAFHQPASGSQATATKAAGAAGVKHVLTFIRGRLTGVAAVLAKVTIELIEDVGGAGTQLWAETMVQPTNSFCDIIIGPINYIQPTAAKSLTIRFAAAGDANASQSVSMFGYSTI